jgi:hypothetical protein
MLRASTAGCVGHLNMRVWAATSADGQTGTRELTSGSLVGTAVTLSTTADVNGMGTTTWSPGAITLNNEYLFFQLEWQETTQGSTNGCNVLYRNGTCLITTTNFTPQQMISASMAGAGAQSIVAQVYDPGGVIYSQSLIGTSFSWQNQTLRQRFEPGVIDAVPAGVLAVQFQFAADSNGSMDAAYIGHAASSGDPYDFDGNQKQLKFGGANNISVSGAQTINSDVLSGFVYDPTRPLIVSAQFSGTLINLMGFGG